MLELFSSGLVSVWLDMAGVQQSKQEALQRLSWLGTPGFFLPTAAEPATAAKVEQYLKELSKKGPSAGQGIWIQSGPLLLANNQGMVPLPAASLTKIATSLAALSTWEPQHEFETVISATGPIKDGVLWGDLVVTGNGDPLFVWEEAIGVANALNRMGIKRVSGNLVVQGNFFMNYQSDPALAGQMFKQALTGVGLPRGVAARRSAPKALKPQVAIAGNVLVFQGGKAGVKPRGVLLLRHRSLTLAQILKQMNVYSNNPMSEMLAQLLGGGPAVAKIAAAKAGVPQQEILLINGSGLGVENRISPRAACAMLVSLQRKLQPHGLTIGDLFPVAGHDRNGTMIGRNMPFATAIKTGTLRDVSALAGVLPTRDRGLVWFAIINRGNDVWGFRSEQDRFLQILQEQWGAMSETPTVIFPSSGKFNAFNLFGADSRNEILIGG